MLVVPGVLTVLLLILVVPVVLIILVALVVAVTEEVGVSLTVALICNSE